ncbi:MAG: hypothetical protein IKV75_05725 [Bacteroidales bacterium]|nr:hypothetical protein [Bacteroidales bacterium]
MTLTTISIIIATVIFVAYNAVALANFGIPHSLSMTYYLWKEKNGKGWLFCLMMYAVVALMMPAWISLSEGSSFQFLAFLAPVAIAFVGTAPAFLDDKMECRVHTVAAIVAAVCSLAWICLVTPCWIAVPVITVLVGARAWFTKSLRISYTYWLESIAFEATFAAAIAYSI